MNLFAVPPFAASLWHRWRAWLARHVLLLALVFLIPAFLLTRWLVGNYRATEHRLAMSWYQQGEADLRAGRLPQAIDAYRAALAYSRDDPAYRFRLAQAQIRAGRLDAASADLHRLWEDRPSDSVINLELARLAAREHDGRGAVRYYNNAIYGQWPQDAAERRRDTQLELIDYLLANGRTAEAQAGLITLAASAPPDAGFHVALGERLLRTGADAAALQQFRDALDLDPASPAARSDAGATAFRLERFADARLYLELAVDAGDRSPATLRMLRIATGVGQLDPFVRGLSYAERVRRVRDALDQATSGFGACVAGLPANDQQALPTAGALHARLADLAPLVGSRAVRDAQVQEDAMDLVFDIEEFLAARCGTSDTTDAALLAIGRSRRGQP